MSFEHEQTILELRSQHLTPKQIARKLGLKPAQVAAIIKVSSEHDAQARLARGELDPIYECLVSGDFPSDRFLAAGEAPPAHNGEDSLGSMSLALVLVTRQERPGRLRCCGYLVDYHCLGVKNVMGPRRVPDSEYALFRHQYYSMVEAGSKSISLAQAQAIVLSALAYAQGLGLSPHRDFNEAAREHLGPWDEQLTIWCGGDDGKPYFIAGPHDSPQQIMRTLDRSVGPGNYHYLAPLDMFDP